MATANPYAKVKMEVLTEVQAFLYDKIINSLQHREKEIVVRNSVLMRTGHLSCTYKGIQFVHESSKPPRGKITRLSPEFHAAMDAVMQEKEAICVYEQAFVMGYIRQALNIAKCIGDMLDLVPESVHRPFMNWIPNGRSSYTPRLPPEVIAELLHKNAKSITLMKTRMLINLIT